MDQKELNQLHKGLEKKIEQMIIEYNDGQDLDNWNEKKAVEEMNQLYSRVDGMNLALKSIAEQYRLKYKELAKPPYLSVE